MMNTKSTEYSDNQVRLVFKTMFEQIAKETGFTCVDRSIIHPVFFLLDKQSKIVAEASYESKLCGPKLLSCIIKGEKITFSICLEKLSDFQLKFPGYIRKYVNKSLPTIPPCLQKQDITLRETTSPIIYWDMESAIDKNEEISLWEYD